MSPVMQVFFLRNQFSAFDINQRAKVSSITCERAETGHGGTEAETCEKCLNNRFALKLYPPLHFQLLAHHIVHLLVGKGTLKECIVPLPAEFQRLCHKVTWH